MYNDLRKSYYNYIDKNKGENNIIQTTKFRDII